MGHQVFISCSSKDKTVGDAACAVLEQRGYSCWIAPRDILAGREWGESIIEGILGAKIFVLIFSTNANESPQISREIERAVHHGLLVIPFRIEDVPPVGSLEYFMSVPHWLDALTPPLERHLEHLAEVVGRLLEAAPSARDVVPAQLRHAQGGPAALVLLGLLMAMPVLAGLLALDPPWPNEAGYVSVGLVAAGAGAAHYRVPLLERAGRPWLRRLTVVLIGAGLLAYLILTSLFVETIPRSGVRVIKGFVCTPDALLVYGRSCPNLGRDALRDAEWEAATLWTGGSLTLVRVGLVMSWLSVIAGVAMLAGVVERGRMRTGGRQGRSR